MNMKSVSYILGWILNVEAALMGLPLVTAIIYGETQGIAFAVTMALCALVGFLLTHKRAASPHFYAREGFVATALSWIVMSVFGCLPFYLSGEIPRFIDALFETVSGFTTTGASILSDVEHMSHCCMLWRCFTHWIGGMGVLVFLLAVLPMVGGSNMHLMKAESPGPVVGKLVPKVRYTARILYMLYIVLTILEFLLLMLGGMIPFEALCTSFGTAGTGGFGFRNDSFASFSPYIQIVITVFMILFAINFNCYFLILTGKLREAFNIELRTFLIIVGVTITIITINISSMYSSVGEALRHSAFTVASLISTTGFTTTDFNLWPELSRTLLVMIMFVGACAGSTGGGIKVSRIIILLKGMVKEIQTMVHPHQVKKIKMDSHTIDHETVRSVNSYMVAYLMIFSFSLILISFDNHDLITSFTAVAATINNIGPGLELVGPTANFEFFSTPTKIVLIFDMLAGRLELFPILLLFTPSTWKK